MDAEKVQDVGGDQDLGLDVAPLSVLQEAAVERLHRFGCLMGGHGAKPDPPCAIGGRLGDLVLGDLPAATLLERESVEVAVELEDQPRSEVHAGVVVMVNTERYPAISCSGRLQGVVFSRTMASILFGGASIPSIRLEDAVLWMIATWRRASST